MSTVGPAVKGLREATGAGLMECRRALAACLGHEDLAARWLKTRGLAIAVRPPALHPNKQAETEARQRGPKREGD